MYDFGVSLYFSLSFSHYLQCNSHINLDFQEFGVHFNRYVSLIPILLSFEVLET